MANLNVRNLDDNVFDALKAMAILKGKRGVEPYVRDILKAHVENPKKQFLADIDKCHSRIEHSYGGILPTNSVDLIREDRDA